MISATWSDDGMYFTLTSLFVITPRMKLYLTSMCFIRLCSRGSSAILMHDWLSSNIIVGSLQTMPTSFNNFRNHFASHTASLSATYLALVDDKLTVGCLRDNQLTVLPNTLNTYPDVDMQSFLSPAPPVWVGITHQTSKRLHSYFDYIPTSNRAYLEYTARHVWHGCNVRLCDNFKSDSGKTLMRISQAL